MLIITNSGKFFERWEYQNTLLAFWEPCMQVKKQQLEMDMEQWTSSKLGKEYVETIYCHPAYLTYMQSEWSEVAQSCPTLWNPMDCSPPHSSIHAHHTPLSRQEYWSGLAFSFPISEYIMWNARLVKYKLESSLPGEISITSDMQMTPLLWQKWEEELKEPFDESERGEWKSWLKTQH